MSSKFLFSALMLVVLISGCESQQDSQRSTAYLQSPGSAASDTTSRAEQSDETATSDPLKPIRKRKIIYNAVLSLVVDDYTKFETQMPEMVEAHGGFIAKSETGRRYNDQQSGVWVARIPVDEYSQFLGRVTTLGFVESQSEDANDVTDEFVDIEARIRNNKKLEDRIIALLEERSGKLADIIEIERELSRVREAIERMEGCLRVLADHSALATITVNVREQQEYVPPDSPTLKSRIGQSWAGSISSLQAVAENLLVVFVAAIPWLAALGPLALLGAMISRRLTANASKPNSASD